MYSIIAYTCIFLSLVKGDMDKMRDLIVPELKEMLRDPSKRGENSRNKKTNTKINDISDAIKSNPENHHSMRDLLVPELEEELYERHHNGSHAPAGWADELESELQKEMVGEGPLPENKPHSIDFNLKKGLIDAGLKDLLIRRHAAPPKNKTIPMTPEPKPNTLKPNVKASPKEEPIPLIVLKNQYSGGSWLVELLNNPKNVFITDEIITGKSWSKGNVTKLGALHLMKALHKPTPRFGNVHEKLFWKNTKKNHKHIDVVGFSVSALRLATIDVNALVITVPNVQVLVLQRSNKVKQAVAEICKRIEGKCKEKSVISVKDLHKSLVKAIWKDQYMLNLAQRLAQVTDKEVLVVTYEAMLGNIEHVMEDVFSWLGKNNLWEESEEDVRHEVSIHDRLVDVIENFKEVEKWLIQYAPCLLDQLNDTSPDTVFLNQDKCYNKFSKELRKVDDSFRSVLIH